MSVKNNKSGSKIPKFMLQTYACVYQRLMDFPQGKFDYETLTTIIFFENIHKITNVKIHLHRSHVTGKIYGYTYDFCSMKVRENKDQFFCVAHNFFGFDMIFLVKGIRLSVWGTKDINIGRSGLRNIASISSQVKFIDSMKYFLTTLGQLASTLNEDEKARVEKLTIQFLNQHSYFSRVWKMLSETETREVLDIIVSGKGVIPHEKINSIDSLNSNIFFKG